MFRDTTVKSMHHSPKKICVCCLQLHRACFWPECAPGASQVLHWLLPAGFPCQLVLL